MTTSAEQEQQQQAQCDEILLGLASRHGGIEPLLRTFFSFLHRKTVRVLGVCDWIDRQRCVEFCGLCIWCVIDCLDRRTLAHQGGCWIARSNPIRSDWTAHLINLSCGPALVCSIDCRIGVTDHSTPTHPHQDFYVSFPPGTPDARMGFAEGQAERLVSYLINACVCVLTDRLLLLDQGVGSRDRMSWLMRQGDLPSHRLI
jgi:hypothetical protein